MARQHIRRSLGFLRTTAHAAFKWGSNLERRMLIGLLGVFFGAWSFAKIADIVIEGQSSAVDRTLLLALRAPGDPTNPIGPHWAEELGRDFTALGGFGFLTFLTLAVLGYLAINKKWHAALVVLIAVLGGWFASSVLKMIFARPRPDLVPHLSYVISSSFPSGHSMMAAVTYLTLGALLTRLEPNWRGKFYFLSLAVFLTIAVGITRVYLGVHWPTDVLAGWAGGAAYASLCWLIALRLQRRGKVERDLTPPEE